MKTYILKIKFTDSQNLTLDTLQTCDLDCFAANFTVYNDNGVLDLLNAYLNNSINRIQFLVPSTDFKKVLFYLDKIGFEVSKVKFNSINI